MKRCLFTILTVTSLWSCGGPKDQNQTSGTEAESQVVQMSQKHTVIFDTDANNELDDQHALAYLLLNGDHFVVPGITVNATNNGGDIDGHFAEAERVLKLCNLEGQIPILKGANADFEDIKMQINEESYDGAEAVDFIIQESLKPRSDKLILLPVGKLTNIALALAKAPSIAEHVRVVWLGSNYPEPGEYNQDNDVPSMNYVLNTGVPFEMVTVRYGKPSGSGAVLVSQEFVNDKMPGLGPQIGRPVTGRHGGTYQTFGDYSVSLFEYIDYHDESRVRSLFDLVAVAIVKNPKWGSARQHPAPRYVDGQWQERTGNTREITIWEHFDKGEIIQDMLRTFAEPNFASSQ